MLADKLRPRELSVQMFSAPIAPLCFFGALVAEKVTACFTFLSGHSPDSSRTPAFIILLKYPLPSAFHR